MMSVFSLLSLRSLSDIKLESFSALDEDSDHLKAHWVTLCSRILCLVTVGNLGRHYPTHETLVAVR